jgi:hypothetical protein
LAAGRILLAQGFYPHEIEQHTFRGLTALTPRALIFRVAIGLSTPLSRDEASRLADALGRALRGAPDRDFDRKMVIAHLYANLERLALQVEARMRRQGVPVTPDTLALLMADELARTRPRSTVVPWFLDQPTVDFVIERVAREIASELYPTC